MDDKVNESEIQQEDPEIKELSDRRDFLRSLGKWSTAAIAAILLSESTSSGQGSWVNRRGSWVNGAGPGGWANRGGSWANGGGAWVNRSGGGWINSRGGGGGSWMNRRG